MEYVRLGTTGIKVSKLCLGCANFGDVVDEEESVRVIRHALDHGINFLDTANAYGTGLAETRVGKAIAGRRDEVILSTKVSGIMGPGPNDFGNNRRHIRQQIDASLDRLGTESIDLYQLHQPDPETSIEESLSTLHDLVHQGKVHYIGGCNLFPHMLSEALAASDRHGYERFATVQVPFNTLDRRIEIELAGLCAEQGVGILAFSPLARGLLSGVHAPEEAPAASRCRAVPMWQHWYPSIPADTFAAVAELQGIANEVGIPVSQLALAWVLADERINSVLIGPRTVAHLDDAIAAAALELDPEVLARLGNVVPAGGYRAG